MPMFEYKCSSCNYEFESLLPTGMISLMPACPECKSNRNVRKLVSSFSTPKSGGNRDGHEPNITGHEISIIVMGPVDPNPGKYN